jgi:hypothetical protein
VDGLGREGGPSIKLGGISGDCAYGLKLIKRVDRYFVVGRLFNIMPAL